MSNFKNKNVVITGASRGIGLSIAKKLAKDGANIAILAKTDVPHPKLPGTIFSAAKEIEQLGVKSLPIKTDIRFDDQVENSIKQVVNEFGSIDVLINNASAINLFNSETLPMKRYDLMHDINVRGTYLCSKTCLPFLKKSSNPHILNLSPPINLKPKYRINVRANPQCITPLTLAMGPIFPFMAFASTNNMTTVENKRAVCEVASPPNPLAAAIKNSIGIENKVFVLEASPAFPRHPAAFESASPPLATLSDDAITTFCAGHIISHTLRNIKVPINAPVYMYTLYVREKSGCP